MTDDELDRLANRLKEKIIAGIYKDIGKSVVRKLVWGVVAVLIVVIGYKI